MNCIHLKQLALALATLGMMSTALAQYVWVNEKGIKQYSDLPPPASIPQNRILKMPGGVSAPETAERTANAAQASDKASVPLSAAEKNADFLKRRAEQAQKEKKTAEDQQVAAAKAKNCDRARDYQRVLDSGERVASVDKNGERSYLSDEQRAREARETRRILEDCK